MILHSMDVKHPWIRNVSPMNFRRLDTWLWVAVIAIIMGWTVHVLTPVALDHRSNPSALMRPR